MIDEKKLIAEIERRRRNLHYGSSIEAKYKREECDDILSIINSVCQQVSPVVSDDLEASARECMCSIEDGDTTHKKCFIKGANWQKQKMMKDGVKGEVIAPLGRKLIEHEAVVCPGKMATPFPVEIMKKFDVGDKVKIVLFKED